MVEELRSDKELLIRIDNHLKMDSLPDGNMLSTLTLMEDDIQLLKDKFPTVAPPTTTPTTTKIRISNNEQYRIRSSRTNKTYKCPQVTFLTKNAKDAFLTQTAQDAFLT